MGVGGEIGSHTHIRTPYIHSPPSLVVGMGEWRLKILFRIFGIIKNKGWEGGRKNIIDDC